MRNYQGRGKCYQTIIDYSEQMRNKVFCSIVNDSENKLRQITFPMNYEKTNIL
jgi:hypothetical protein